jgi:hypothetical protein
MRLLSFCLMLCLVACAPTVVPPTPAAPALPTALLKITTTGGLCPYGLCQTEFEMETDGHYVAREGGAVVAEGVVEAAPLAAFNAAVQTADFAALKAQPFTDTCPSAYDGSEVIYTFYTAAGPEVISACAYVVDPQHPLFAAANALWQAAQQPWSGFRLGVLLNRILAWMDNR